MNRNLLFAPVVALVAILASGCGAILSKKNIDVMLDSMPQGASVTVDGMPVGQTPVQARVSNRTDHQVVFELNGDTRYCSLGSSVSAGYVILDIFIGGLIGIVVDAATDGWRTLDDTSCFVTFGTPRQR